MSRQRAVHSPGEAVIKHRRHDLYFDEISALRKNIEFQRFSVSWPSVLCPVIHEVNRSPGLRYAGICRVSRCSSTLVWYPDLGLVSRWGMGRTRRGNILTPSKTRQYEHVL